MLRKWIPVAACVTVLLAGVPSTSADGARATLPPRLVGANDGEPVQVTSTIGQTWAAWAFFSRGEYSIALARYHDELWSEPVFLGLDDGRSQIDPVLETDDRGNIYLAYSVYETGEIFMSARYVAFTWWFEPRRVTGPPTPASSPSLRAVGDRLVLAYRSGDDVVLEDFELLPYWYSMGGGIQEGPDGFPLPARYEPGVQELPEEDASPTRFGRPSRRRADDSSDGPHATP